MKPPPIGRRSCRLHCNTDPSHIINDYFSRRPRPAAARRIHRLPRSDGLTHRNGRRERSTASSLPSEHRVHPYGSDRNHFELVPSMTARISRRLHSNAAIGGMDDLADSFISPRQGVGWLGTSHTRCRHARRKVDSSAHTEWVRHAIVIASGSVSTTKALGPPLLRRTQSPIRSGGSRGSWKSSALARSLRLDGWNVSII
jgi:hypothetical protein